MDQNIKFEPGDSVKFGEQWCKDHNSEHLKGKIIMMTPQWFEYDDDFGGGLQQCAGMLEEGSEEPDSIYHLFGNNFEYFSDCELIKGSEEDKVAYNKIIKDAEEAQAKMWEEAQ
ncbi:hypothetical protein [Paenibacillus sp. IHBB 3054]|uniref:hypothetical protein n=1 Tax=Paenibacillus sp. IHBB 3054 TaxID=3425689 RepID=UPI003F67DE58